MAFASPCLAEAILRVVLLQPCPKDPTVYERYQKRCLCYLISLVVACHLISFHTDLEIFLKTCRKYPTPTWRIERTWMGLRLMARLLRMLWMAFSQGQSRGHSQSSVHRAGLCSELMCCYRVLKAIVSKEVDARVTCRLNLYPFRNTRTIHSQEGHIRKNTKIFLPNARLCLYMPRWEIF